MTLMAKKQFDNANCMTDKLSSLACLAGLRESDSQQEREEALQKFYNDAAGNALVVNKWFAIQATADYPGVLGSPYKLLFPC